MNKTEVPSYILQGGLLQELTTTAKSKPYVFIRLLIEIIYITARSEKGISFLNTLQVLICIHTMTIRLVSFYSVSVEAENELCAQYTIISTLLAA